MEKISAVKDFLTCPVCLDTFKEPVSLTCHHSFCSNCLQEYWDQNSTRNCPVCRRKSSKEHLDVNFALKELTVSFSQKEEAPGGERPVVCTSHPEQTPLFCLDESRPLCPACEFSLHSGHKVVTVDSVVSEKKKQLVSQQQSLFQRRKKASNKQTQCEQIQELAHAQVEACERHIRAEFERLHQIREELCTVEQNLLTVEDLLKKQNMDFLTQYRDTHKDRQTLLSQPSPQLRPGLLINQPKVLANVAFKRLEEDESPGAGSEGFSSGSHQWDVEVGDHPDWAHWFDQRRSPQRIRVRLDCDEGTVSFFDAGDMSLICSHKDRFTEKMFPYFYVESPPRHPGEIGLVRETSKVRVGLLCWRQSRLQVVGMAKGAPFGHLPPSLDNDGILSN
ncbi:E3 ubiquitin-protein ligase TRIM35-like [Periophthalmus magnuspinnatus]|uniref:E3 ubiquitin-protein ligase TRIM35-like n=1 Tax=Periophthalmus magnuspinnatus TaxID=409849 RepID=UPI0024372F70|nr:E3 ubiquitin-protein ligase TRIM35-like [Periophthalmus magnuspinnatus]